VKSGNNTDKFLAIFFCFVTRNLAEAECDYGIPFQIDVVALVYCCDQIKVVPPSFVLFGFRM
jgi:hypothetical protein